MTQIRPLSIDGLHYAGGLVRLFYSSTANLDWTTDYYVVPTMPIDVPPASELNPGSDDDGSGPRLFWPLGCKKVGPILVCTTCIKTPCPTPPRPPPSPNPPPKLAFSRKLTFGTQISITSALPGGPMLSISGASSTTEVKARVEEWLAGQECRLHVYLLGEASVAGLPPALGSGSYVALPVDMTDASAKSLASFVT